MPIQLTEEHAGKILNVQVSVTLAKEDYAVFVPAFERLVELHGKLSVKIRHGQLSRLGSQRRLGGREFRHQKKLFRYRASRHDEQTPKQPANG